ncbi:nuclear transport factor 2 family protein [Streptomyces sp. NBC_00386]|uniref:nuclear transport factor 2 family protein n=1 Tax=Streptomyces sp. NBC_00386 TaxID=2975734 RepID=UPI002E1D3305
MSAGVSALADRFFAAVSRGDLAELDALYSPDVAVWHNYDDVEQTREESLRLLSWLAAKAGPLRYANVRRTVLDDGFVQQHVVELGGRCEGIRMPAMLRVFCDDRHIRRIEEYVDPGPLNARLAASGH